MDSRTDVSHTRQMKVSSAAAGLKRLRERAKMSVRELAEALGRPASTYASYEDKFKKPFLPVELVTALAPILEKRGVSADDVWALAGIGKKNLLKERAEDAGRISTGSVQEPLTPEAINIQHMPRDVPILGSGSCGEDGLFEFNGQTLDHARRPPRLQNVKDAYALFVSGLSMSPWREPGQLVYVHPHQPPKVGDYVVVQIHPEKPSETPDAYIKKLVRRTEKDLKLLQYTPREELILPMRKVKAIHRVIDWDELLGL